ncbi:MAG: 50S ribosome-binding GTPase [Candidatus Heimdallarchaeota archaeon]|nr:50S ribosome-binding GTPase [Candidatus Heimdallarchaeota archaeon]
MASNLLVMRAISIFHKKYRWMDDHQEMSDLILASGHSEITSLSFKKIQNKNYLPQTKMEQLKDLLEQYQVNTIIFNEALSVKHVQKLVQGLERDDIIILDKPMLILQIFALKANSKEIQLQIKLAEIKYVIPRMRQELGVTLHTDKQARERGTGESLADIMKSDFKSRISDMEKQLEAFQNASAHVSRVLTFPVLGFYSVGKTTLFNILTGSSRETDSQAFTTMFLKSSWSKLLGFPVEIVDTVGIVDLPAMIIDSFSMMLRRIFSSPHLIICADTAMDLQFFTDQLDGLANYYSKFAHSGLKYRILFVLTKCDNLSELKFNEYRQLLTNLIMQGKFPCEQFEIMGARSDRPKYVQQTFVAKIEKLLEGELLELDFLDLTPSESSKIHDFANVRSEVWVGDTASIKSIIPIQTFNEHLAALQTKLDPKCYRRWEILRDELNRSESPNYFEGSIEDPVIKSDPDS